MGKSFSEGSKKSLRAWLLSARDLDKYRVKRSYFAFGDETDCKCGLHVFCDGSEIG